MKTYKFELNEEEIQTLFFIIHRYTNCMDDLLMWPNVDEEYLSEVTKLILKANELYNSLIKAIRNEIKTES